MGSQRNIRLHSSAFPFLIWNDETEEEGKVRDRNKSDAARSSLLVIIASLPSVASSERRPTLSHPGLSRRSHEFVLLYQWR